MMRMFAVIAPVIVAILLLMPSGIAVEDLESVTGGQIPDCDTTGTQLVRCRAKPLGACPLSLKHHECKPKSQVPLANVRLCDPDQGGTDSCDNAGCEPEFDDSTSTNCNAT